jgi:hypothetical protein
MRSGAGSRPQTLNGRPALPYCGNSHTLKGERLRQPA